MSELFNATVKEKIAARFAEHVLETTEFRGQLAFTVKQDRNCEIAEFLKTDPDLAYDYLEDICGADYLEYEGAKDRFCVIYQFYSFKNNHRVRVKVFLPGNNPSLDSLTCLWKSAGFPEREIYDMYGITFRNHPDMRRLLMPDDFGSNPLRKDYPLKGKGERDRFPKYTIDD